MPTLYIIATPIGNLQDISQRALDTLRAVDAILCEDTRVTAKLLAHFQVSKPLIAYHHHSAGGVTDRIASMLADGNDLALVSDAGTPGINDLGGRLIATLVSRLPDLRIVPLPGANAAITALSASGFPAERFTYLGFVPHKKGRQTLFSEIAAAKETVVFYESKHRITKTLEQLASALAVADTPDRPVTVARELTKKFETFYRGTAVEIAGRLTGDDALGEFVVVVAPSKLK